MNKYVTIILCLFLIGCVPEKTMRQDRIQHDTPNDQYLTAIGHGNSIIAARHNAKAELSNIFESRIESQLTIAASSVVDSMKGDHDTDEIHSSIKVFSRVQLKGLTVEDIQSKNGLYKARAILDKIKARKNWLSEIQKLDTLISVEYKALNEMSPTVMSIRPIQKIWHYWMQRNALESRLTVIGFSAPHEQFQMKPILQMMSDLQKQMQIKINIAGKHAKYLSDEIAGILNNRGFLITRDPAHATVVIKGNIDIHPLTNNSDWKFCRAMASIQIIDLLTGSQVCDINETCRRGHLTQHEAYLKALKAVSQTVNNKLIDFFDILGNKPII